MFATELKLNYVENLIYNLTYFLADRIKVSVIPLCFVNSIVANYLFKIEKCNTIVCVYISNYSCENNISIIFNIAQFHTPILLRPSKKCKPRSAVFKRCILNNGLMFSKTTGFVETKSISTSRKKENSGGCSAYRAWSFFSRLSPCRAVQVFVTITRFEETIDFCLTKSGSHP